MRYILMFFVDADKVGKSAYSEDTEELTTPTTGMIEEFLVYWSTYLGRNTDKQLHSPNSHRLFDIFVSAL